MKRLSLAACIIAAAILVSRCSPSTPPTVGGAMIRLDTADSSIFCSYETAKQNIAYYQRISKMYLDSVPINYYTVRARDLFAALGMDSIAVAGMVTDKKWRYPYIRVTMGVDSAKKQFKLYIQPVKGANLDSTHWVAGWPLYFRKDGTIDSVSDPIANPSAGANVYLADLNAPCPNTCGPAPTK